MSVPPRAYQASDLMSLKRNELIQLIRSQRPEMRLNSNLNKNDLRSFLLNPQYGFTTTNPPVDLSNTGMLAGNVKSFADPYDPGASSTQPSASVAPSIPSNEQDLAGTPVLLPSENVDGCQQLVRLRVFMDDTRYNPTQKTSKCIDVNIFLYGNAAQAGWLVRTRDVLLKIQEGYGKLTGSGITRIGIPDSVDPSFTEYFVEAPLTELINAPMIPFLFIQDGPNPSLALRVSKQLL